MTKQEQNRIGLGESEVKQWDELSHDDKAWVVNILKENGFDNAEDAIAELDFDYEKASFGRFWLAVSDSDEADMQTYFNEHTIEDVELHKGSYQRGDTLSYVADGEPVSVTGEFFVDKNHNLHHTHIFSDGTEQKIVVAYE